MESKYKSLAEWCKADNKAYEAAKRNGLFPEICELFGWKFSKITKINSENSILSKLGLDINEYNEYKSKLINE